MRITVWWLFLRWFTQTISYIVRTIQETKRQTFCGRLDQDFSSGFLVANASVTFKTAHWEFSVFMGLLPIKASQSQKCASDQSWKDKPALEGGEGGTSIRAINSKLTRKLFWDSKGIYTNPYDTWFIHCMNVWISPGIQTLQSSVSKINITLWS